MIHKIAEASKLTLVTISLFIGFLGGVVFTVYQAPSITSKLPDSGQSQANKIDWPQHINHLKKSLDQDPNNAETWSQLANAYYEIQDYKQSIDSYQKVISLVDEKSSVFLELGVVYRKNGQFKKSIEAFEKAIAENPANLRALFNIGIVQYHDLDDETSAKKTWQKVADANPDFQLSTGQTIQQLVEQLK
jgi:tetratricopeptide (TPR) repeat protein